MHSNTHTQRVILVDDSDNDNFFHDLAVRKCGFAGECIRLRRFNPATVAVSERERNGKAGNEGRLTPVIDTPHTAACCHIRDRIGTCHPDACLSSIALGSGKLLVEGRCLGRECPWHRLIDPRWH